MEVFVINLARSSERRTRMRAQLAAAGVRASFVAAVDGSTLAPSSMAAYDRRRAWLHYGSEMTPAEIACCLSHFAVLEEIVRRGLPYALVLEDDVEIDADLLRTCLALVAQPFAAWEVVRLQASKGRVSDPRTARDLGAPICTAGRRRLYRLDHHVLGACAYLITQSGAQKMLDYGRRIFLPFDHALDRYWENGLIPYVVRPFPVRPRDGVASEIGVRGEAAFGGLRGRLWWRRRRARLSDSLRKRLFNLCLRNRAAARALAVIGVGVARTALAAAPQLGPRKTPLTAPAPVIQLDAARRPAPRPPAHDGEAAGPPAQKSRRTPSVRVRGRSGVTSGAERTLNGLP